MAFMQANPWASTIGSMMAGGGMSGGGFPSGVGGNMTRMNDSGGGGAPVSPSGGISPLMSSIRSMMNPGGMGGVAQGLQGRMGGGMAGNGMLNGLDPNMLMMHLMNGGSLGSLMQMLQGQQGQQGQPGGMAMNPAMMGGFTRPMAR